MKSSFFKITGFKIGLMATFLIVILYFSNVEFLNLIELKALDFRFIQRGEESPTAPVVIVGIDDKSVKKLGRWPWPRSYIADLIDFMTEAKAKVVGFDITFAEPDLNSEMMLLDDINLQRKNWKFKDDSFDQYIQKKREAADNDERLAQAIKRNGKVILGYFFHTEETESHLDAKSKQGMTGNLELIAPSKLSAVYYSSDEAEKFKFEQFNTADVNIKKLSDNCLGFGYFNVFPDVDGTVRWIPLVVKYEGELFPPLSLQVLREFLRKEGTDEENIIVRVNELGLYEIKLYDYKIPTDANGKMMINFRGPEYTFKSKSGVYHSFVDIIEGKVSKEEFKDKMVLVGANAMGIYDLRVTPFSSVYPGVETHANIIDNILNRNSLASPDWAKGVDILTIILLGLIISYIIPKYNAQKSAILALLLLSGYITLNYLVFARLHIWLNVIYPVLVIVTLSLTLYTYRFATEEREKRWIRGIFSQYVSSAVVNDMLKNPDKLKLGGEKKDLTAFFSDIRGFTTISEGLSPTDLVKMLNEYLTAMTKIVFKHEGTLDKYMGDAIMAIYGAPLEQPDHPLRACKTAIEMIRELQNLQADSKKRGLPKIDIGIGINTGAMSVGNMGSEMRFDYTVMGDNVNLASRLEGTNKEYGTNIIISESTYEQVKNELICRPLDLVKVKGKKLPVKIYQLLAEKNDSNADYYQNLSRQFEFALNKYFAKEFKESMQILKKLDESYADDKPVKLFLSRIENFINNPPPADWDGVFTMKTK